MSSLVDRLLKRKPKPIADEKISYRKQQFDYDCGQTCLDMLGWDGHQIFPEEFPEERCFLGSKAAEIFGYTRNQISYTELNEDTFFENPYLLNVMRCDQWGWHAVIGFKDQIYCPSLGIFKIPEYTKYIWSSATGFPVPFAQESELNLPRLTPRNSQRVL